MNNLLHAGFRRLWRDRLFWALAALVAAVSLVNAWNVSQTFQSVRAAGFVKSLDDYFFELAPYAGMICAVFCGLFLGSEHGDGALRSKLCVGHTRRAVYLADFLVCFCANAVFLALWLLGQTPGFFLIGPLEMGIPGLLAYIAVALGFTAVFTALFVWLNLRCTNRALAVVLCLGLWVVLILAGSGVVDRLDEPPTSGGMAYINGEFVMQSEQPNPLYVSGGARTALELLRDLLPSGQSLQMHDASIQRPLLLPPLSAGLCLLLLWAGLMDFKRSNIK